MTDSSPRLTRRDALAALAAAGFATGAMAGYRSDGASRVDGERTLGESALEVLVAVAEVVYPSDVSGIREFVETYSVGRVRDRPEYAAGLADAADTLDSTAGRWYDAPYVELSPEKRDRVLREMLVHTADPDPRGADRERVRYYLVNELLFALYSSPTGGRLVGIENPQGHAGGTTSYRRGPES